MLKMEVEADVVADVEVKVEVVIEYSVLPTYILYLQLPAVFTAVTVKGCLPERVVLVRIWYYCKYVHVCTLSTMR